MGITNTYLYHITCGCTGALPPNPPPPPPPPPPTHPPPPRVLALWVQTPAKIMLLTRGGLRRFDNQFLRVLT